MPFQCEAGLAQYRPVQRLPVGSDLQRGQASHRRT